MRQLCDDHGIIMIADEIQTGFARTGRMFAMENYDVVPDITTMAKGLAGGLPLAALTGRAEIMDAAQPGGLGGTYGGLWSKRERPQLGCSVQRFAATKAVKSLQ